MRVVLLCLALLAIAACDDDGSGSFTQSPEPGPAGGTGSGGGGGTGPSPAEGIWWGTLKEGGTTVYYAQCLITKTSRITCELADPSLMPFGAFVGTMNNGGMNFTGSAFTTAGGTFANSTEVSTATGAIGVLNVGHTLAADVTFGGHVYLLNQAIDSRYANPSSLATIGGVYQSFSFSGSAASLSIDANGQLFAQDQAGCVASGPVSVIDPTVNGYSVNVTISNCSSLNGNYAGLAMQEDNTHFSFTLFSTGTGRGIDALASK